MQQRLDLMNQLPVLSPRVIIKPRIMVKTIENNKYSFLNANQSNIATNTKLSKPENDRRN